MTDMKHIQPERLAGLGRYGDGAALTVRFVDEPKKRGEHSLAALDIARSYDALPGIEQDRLGEYVRLAWKRQEGSKEARAEASRRFERLDWLLYVLNLRREGWTLEDLFKHTDSTAEEEATVIAMADAIEAWLRSETQRKDCEKAEVSAEKPASPVSAPESSHADLAAANALGLGKSYVGTPGLAYLSAYLPQTDCGDANWLAESINNGTILACPRCHFLRLPRLPFPPDAVLGRRIEEGLAAPPLDDCDVCAFLPEACRLHLVPRDISQALAGASESLAEQRALRAATLYALYMEPVNGADALLWAGMSEALDGVRTLPQKQVSTK